MPRDPEPVRIPDHVPDAWVVRYHDEWRERRDDRLAVDLARIERSMRRDTALLLGAATLCTVMLVVALGWVGAAVGLGDVEVPALAVAVVLAAFWTCLRLVRRAARRHPRGGTAHTP